MNSAHRQGPWSKRRNSPCPHLHLAISQPNAESQLAGRIRRLVKAACAARAGAAHMSLNDWREVEQELQRKLLYERSTHLP